MRYIKRVEMILTQKTFVVLPLVVSAIGALTSISRLSDQHYDIVQAGARWMYGAILYVQSYSTHSPQTMYLGYLYRRLLTNGFTQFLFELLTWGVAAILVYALSKKILKKSVALRNALLLAFAAMTFVPGVWAHGLSDQKVGTLFVALFVYGYIKWKESGPTIWLLGTTAKNWRFILLAGIALSLAVYTSWLYLFLCIPILFDFSKQTNMDIGEKLRWSVFLIAPFLLETWVWISYMSSRSLLSSYFDAQIIGIKESAHVGGSLGLALPVIFVLGIILVTLLIRASGGQFNTKRAYWAWACFALVLIAIWPMWMIYGCIVCIPTLLFLQNKKTVGILRPWVVAVLASTTILLSVPLRLVAVKQADLDTAKVQIATAFIEQRLVDSNTVIYYGRDAGFYELSAFRNPTRYSDLSVLAHDTSSANIEALYRGDAEAETPMFAVIATDEEYRSPATPRLDQYLTKHYEVSADLDGYQVLKRR